MCHTEPVALVTMGEFTAHSGAVLSYKIDCDALGDEDIAAFAALIASRFAFGGVTGIPRGGLRLAKALEPYITHGPQLIVDDVLTTGGRMAAERVATTDRGVVLFARGPCPPWVTPVFVLSERFR